MICCAKSLDLFTVQTLHAQVGFGEWAKSLAQSKEAWAFCIYAFGKERGVFL